MPAILTILDEDDVLSVAAETADAEMKAMVEAAAESDARVRSLLRRSDETADALDKLVRQANSA